MGGRGNRSPFSAADVDWPAASGVPKNQNTRLRAYLGDAELPAALAGCKAQGELELVVISLTGSSALRTGACSRTRRAYSAMLATAKA